MAWCVEYAIPRHQTIKSLLAVQLFHLRDLTHIDSRLLSIKKRIWCVPSLILILYLFSAAKNNKAEISDTDVSVRFKIGLHTFALFIDSLSLWSTISEQLSAIIKARYGATGLATFNNSIALPTTQKWRIVYAKPKNLQDGGDGWTPLKFDEETETPARSGLTDGCVLAFAVWPDTETRTPVDADFVVDMPPMDDDSNGDDMEDSRSEDPFDLATE